MRRIYFLPMSAVPCVVMRTVFALFLFWGIGRAQSIQIIGEAPFFPSTRIEAIGFEDWVVSEPILLSSTLSSATGHFELTIPTSLAQQVAYQLKIGRDKTALHLQAGKTYRLVLPNRNAGAVGMTQENDTSLIWYSISQFEMAYSTFLNDHYDVFMRRQHKTAVDSFELALRNDSAQYSSPFLASMLKYRMADLRLTTRLMSEKTAVRTYIFNQPVLYSHPDYMDFFKNLYKGMLQKWATLPTEAKLYEWLIEKPNYDSAFHRIMEFELVPGREAAELLLVAGMLEWQREKILDEAKLITLFQQAWPKQIDPVLQRITQKAIEHLQRLKPGQQVPDLTLKDELGQRFQPFSKKNGLHTYLIFFSFKSPEALAEVKAASDFIAREKRKINLISVCLDCQYTDLHNLKKQHNLQGQLGMPIEDPSYTFKLGGFVDSFLLDENQRFVLSPAPNSSTGGLLQIQKVAPTERNR
jgi:hypothetical protein